MNQPQLTRPILIVDLVKGYGGAEVRVQDTARALHGAYEYAVATLADSPLHQRLTAAGLTALPVPYARSDPRLLPFLRRQIRQGGYGIIDAHNVQSQFWGHLAGALSSDVATISTVHSTYALEHANSARGRLYESVLRLNARLGVRFIAVSAGVYDYLQSIGIPSHRVTLIHNSIQLPADTSPYREHPLLQSLGWDDQKRVVIAVGRLEPVKGHNFLIEAMQQLAPHYPNLRCLIVGEGRTRPDLEAQIEAARLSDRVHLAGFRRDIPDLLRAADIFCMPSLSEGLPYALLEACAYRLPLLVSNVGGMAELLRHQETAYLVPPADSDALAAGLAWGLDHPADLNRMVETAGNWLAQHFSPTEMIAQTLKVYAGGS